MASAGTVAAALRELREARRLSVAETSRRAGVSRATVHQWESGAHTPPGPALERLLDVLGAGLGERTALLAAADPRHAQVALAGAPLGAPISRGAILRAMRIRRELAQSAVAQALGVTQGAVAKWESGDNAPDDEALARLVAVLGVSAGEADALRTARETEGALTIEEADARTRSLQFDCPMGFKEPLLLAHEAEVWRRAIRDPRWEPSLVLTMGLRACWTRGAGGRPEDGLPVARRALEIAARCGAWDEAELAFGCFLDHAVFDLELDFDRLAKGLRRTESFVGRVKSPRSRASLLGSTHNLVAAESRSPGSMGEIVRRVQDALLEGAASARDTALDPLGFVNYQVPAYLALGRIDEMVSLDETTDWSASPDGGAWRRAQNLGNRMHAYLNHGMEPSADELRRFEDCWPLYASVPATRHRIRDWHRAYDARNRRRYV